MGIDVYAEWKDQTKEEKEAQYTGYATNSGNVGYLREAYRGSPYATEVLAPECFEGECKEQIPAATLRKRLPEVVRAARERIAKVYKGDPDSDESQPTIKSFVDFVELCERKEEETGTPVTIFASY